MSNKVWNLMYALGNTDRIVGDADNPHARRTALEGAAVIDKTGWCVWVEHHKTGERLYEREREKAHREAAAA
ncbi:hypothetical protein ACI2UK_24490 [Ralstonia nicotianae]